MRLAIFGRSLALRQELIGASAPTRFAGIGPGLQDCKFFNEALADHDSGTGEVANLRALASFRVVAARAAAPARLGP